MYWHNADHLPTYLPKYLTVHFLKPLGSSLDVTWKGSAFLHSFSYLFQIEIENSKMDPLSITVSATALATFAFRASKAIYTGVENVKNADPTLLQ